MNGLVRNFSALIGAVFLPLLSIYIFPYLIGGIILKGLRLLFKSHQTIEPLVRPLNTKLLVFHASLLSQIRAE